MKRSIKNLMLLSWIITILFLSSVFILFFVYQKRREFAERSNSFQDNFIRASQETLKQAVDDNIEFLSLQVKKFDNDQPGDRSSLQKSALDSLKKIHFLDKQNGTLFIINFQGEVISHPDRNMIGTNLTEMVDVRGGNPFYHIINELKNKNNFYEEYKVYDQNLDKYVKILIYAAAFSRWNWIVCGEISMNKLENQILDQKVSLRDALIKDTVIMLSITLVITLIAIGLSLQFSNSINRQMGRLLAFFENPSTKDNPISEEEFEYTELKFIAKSSYGMAEKILELNEELAKMLERAKGMALQAESASQSKSFFFMNISHELRTRMNGIMGMSELLSETELNDNQKRFTQTISQSCNSLMELIKEISDFSHIETGKLVLKPGPFRLDKPLKNLAHTFEEWAKRKEINFEFLKDDDIPDFVVGDKNRLKEVLGILIENAIRFTHSGFVRFSVSCQQKDDQTATVYFEVRDSGLGISEEKLKTIFEFAQDFNLSARRFSGISLGLAVCKQLVSLMKGELKVESEKGKGTMFCFSVPFELSSANEALLEEKGEHLALQTTEVLRTRNIKVLLAEDDTINQSVTKLYLSRYGCSVDITNNGKEALERMKNVKYDIIFMDCEMPEMDGYTAVKSIRKMEKETGEHIPIIALTANALKGDRTMCITTGMDDHVTKPINKKIIKEILNKYFQS